MPTKKPEIITVYESTYTDGYTDFPGGDYFRTRNEALVYSRLRYSGRNSFPISHNVIKVDGLLFILKQEIPITLISAEQEMLEAQKRNALLKRDAALNKLTDEDKAILGL